MKKIDVLVEKRVKDILRVRRILLILDYVENSRTSVVEELKDLEVPKSTYYEWRKQYLLEGKKGLERKKPIARSHPRQLSNESIEKILELRRKYQLGPARITWYLERYFDIKTSQS